MNNQDNFLKLLLFLTITTMPCLNSCATENTYKQEDIIFPDDQDDKEINLAIVAYNIYNNNIYFNKSFSIPDNAPMYIKKEIWEKEQKAIDEHKKKFKLFTDIIPEEFRKEITQLTFFYPEEGSNVYAYIGARKKNSLNQFSLGLAYDVERGKTQIPSFSAPDYKHNTLGYDMTTYAMIHEFGHYITKNKTQEYLYYFPESDSYGSTYKEGSFIKQIVNISWEKVSELPTDILMNPSKIFNSLPGDFVSAYACSSMDEDGAETFTHFVLLNDKPEATDGKNKKILLFYKDPEMMKIRTGIRQNLQKLGIVPGTPNM
ncbi:hypothetical protein MTQ00_21915 [Chryseobacterium sp. B21-037]|uniref:hypothetical protein n=1 Tax=Chryseobacterium sp. B21-037 TaxID=2926038 RepID=UPI0023588DD2|nr:hypothetical protein [Chryseobacterium sp. B21-037]MDC8107146.1 hypothetical protein [Chryseobacterium sp. B21-037]WBV56341.1 hypothetical protein PFY10_19320 [Chryseobacterium daecheongense]